MEAVRGWVWIFSGIAHCSKQPKLNSSARLEKIIFLIAKAGILTLSVYLNICLDCPYEWATM